MGISGLLPLLQKASKKSHVRNFSGCRVAIDAYCWLHKGAFGCAEKLDKGEPTTAYITYCMKYIQVLLDNNITPILVLDGRNLPSKEHTEKKRREKRQENRKLARKSLQEGKKKEAWECFTKCVDITPEMAREFIKVLRERKIDYVVAPHEADAQLAYLARKGIADVIITEDSDLILFGCPRIFFKMNVYGDGVFFDASKLPQCLGLTPKKFDFDRFRWMCILSGCDYLASLPGIGLGRAQKVMLAANDNDMRKMILSIPTVLEKLQIDVPEEYIDAFIQAERTFLYQLVFDTISRKVVPLTPYPDSIDKDELSFGGAYHNAKLALDMALGNVDIHSLKTVDSFEPLRSGYTNQSIWSNSFTASKVDTTGIGKNPKLTSNMTAMQISPIVSTLKKKRPLAVTNMANDNNPIVGDNELMSMYADHTDAKIELDTEEGMSQSEDSPQSAKRRRLTLRKTEEKRG